MVRSFLCTAFALSFASVHAEADSPVDHSQPLQLVRSKFELADGAAAQGNVLFVPDVKAKQLWAYRVNAKENAWKLVNEGAGGFSGTFYQLGQLYLSDNSGARLLRSNGWGRPEEWVVFSDGARPNDLVVDDQGNAYVTLTKEGEIRRVAADGTITSVAEEIVTPNGITLSADGTWLYVSSFRPGEILRFRVQNGQLTERSLFANLPQTADGPRADGMCIDRAGNVYCAGAQAVCIWNPDGELIEQIKTPERPINCTFGGPHGLDLYISTFGGVYRQAMHEYGVQPNPPSAGDRASLPERPSTALPEDLLGTWNTVYYREGNRNLLCDMLVPQRDVAGLPAIVLVHGGGWLHGDKTKFRPLAIKLAEHGFVVMVIEYRLGKEAAFPAAIKDCNAAVRYLRSNAVAYNVDPDRIAAVGGSAGGHLVGLMATGQLHAPLHPTGQIPILEGGHTSSSSQLAAAVIMAGPLQIATGSVAERSIGNAKSNATQWIGGDAETLPDAYHMADAHEKINSDTPPMLFLVGSEDNPERNQASRESLRQSGVSAKVVIHQGASHGHWNRIDWMEQVVDDISSFLGEHL